MLHAWQIRWTPIRLSSKWYPRDSVGFPELHPCNQELTSSRLHASRFFFAAQDPHDDHVYHVF